MPNAATGSVVLTIPVAREYMTTQAGAVSSRFHAPRENIERSSITLLCTRFCMENLTDQTDFDECWAILVPPRPKPKPKTPKLVEGVPPTLKVPRHYLDVGLDLDRTATLYGLERLQEESDQQLRARIVDRFRMVDPNRTLEDHLRHVGYPVTEVTFTASLLTDATEITVHFVGGETITLDVPRNQDCYRGVEQAVARYWEVLRAS